MSICLITLKCCTGVESQEKKAYVGLIWLIWLSYVN